MNLPSGWKVSRINNAPPSKFGGKQPTDDGLLLMLLRASPADAAREASLTIVRDEGFAASQAGVFARRKLLDRLVEIAAGQGYMANEFSFKGDPNSLEHIVLGQVKGADADGKARVFACVSIGRPHEASIRCYWQWNESDELSKLEFEIWLAYLNFKEKNVAAALAATPASLASSWSSSSSRTPESVSAPANTVATVAAAPSPAEVASPSTLSVRTTTIAEMNKDALVVIEGEKGVGSGFVCNFEGKPVLMTNTHVLAGNPGAKFTTMNGASLTAGPSFLGVDQDLCRISVTGGKSALEIITPEDGVIKIGDPVAVLGNAEGAGVIHPLEGKIVGLGPNLIEVDAPFVPGNSGSPIVHLPTGKVVGIATYLTIRKFKKDDGRKSQSDEEDKKQDAPEEDPNVETVVRRFGYRIEHIKSWEALDWARFYAQAAQAEKIESASREFVQLFSDAKGNNLSSMRFSNAGIRRALENAERATKNNSRMSEADRMRVMRDLVGALRQASLADINTFDTRTAYDYFRRQVTEEKKFRDDVAAGFTRVLEANR